MHPWNYIVVASIMAAFKMPDDATFTPAKEDTITGEYEESSYCRSTEFGFVAAAANSIIKICKGHIT